MFKRFKESTSEKNQIVEKAEQIISESGFTGIVEDDFKKAESSMEKQAFLVETLLYRYEHASAADKPAILDKLYLEVAEFSKIVHEDPIESVEELYEAVARAAIDKPVTKSICIGENEIKVSAKVCGEYFNGERFEEVVSSEIYLNDECLFSNIPTEGIWSCATNLNDLKLVSTGMFDYPRDAIGYINYSIS